MTLWDKFKDFVTRKENMHNFPYIFICKKYKEVEAESKSAIQVQTPSLVHRIMPPSIFHSLHSYMAVISLQCTLDVNLSVMHPSWNRFNCLYGPLNKTNEVKILKFYLPKH